jgi:tripartite-type tricarboxylate transporter receptor subunit TctC
MLALAGSAPAWPGAPAADAAAAARPLRLIVPFQPAGGTDLLARQLAARLGPALQQPAVVQNIPGAGGALAVAALLREPADGQTLLVTTSSPVVLLPLLNPKVGHASSDLQPVALLHTDSWTLVTAARGPLRALRDLRSGAQAAEAAPRVGFVGVGSAGHLLTLKLQQAWGRSLVEVPYQGAAQALHDLATGELEAVVLTTSTAAVHIGEGTVIGLAISDAQRRSCLPQVPTFSEQGVPLVWQSWSGVLGPAGMPAPTVARLNRAIKQVLAQPDVQRVAQAQCLVSAAASSDEFGAQVRHSTERWRAEVAPFLAQLARHP